MSLLHDCLPCVCVLWRLHVRCFHVCLSSAFYMSMSLCSEDVGVSDHYALLWAVSVLWFLRRPDLCSWRLCFNSSTLGTLHIAFDVLRGWIECCCVFSSVMRIACRCVCVVRANCNEFPSKICLYVSLCCGGCVSRCRDKLCWLWLTGPLMCCVVGLNDVVCFSTVVRIAFGCVCVVRASCKEVYSMVFFCASLCCGGCMSIVCLYTNYSGVWRLWLIG